MAKITAVIDIGSNSARMVVFESSSRFGFHLLKEIKSRVRISEGTYENGGLLQETPINRAFSALREFLTIAKKLKARKILCVATSAVRDAPNSNIFISRVKKELGLNIKVIEGEKEAFFGGLSAVNLLPISSAITIDIGGGSTECALIENGKIIDLISLNLGTIRLKELFFDKKADIEVIKEFIQKEIDKIPPTYRTATVIGIGGTIRALSKSIMKTYKYPINSIHGFEYLVSNEIDRIDNIISSPTMKLKNFNIKSDRFDTIREGSIIFYMLLKLFEADRVITSGAGVREGVYLNDLLRNTNGKFPVNFNVSVKSLTDRFMQNELLSVANYNQNLALKLFDILKPLHNIDDTLKCPLKYATKLSKIGNRLNFYNALKASSYFILNNLSYGFSHQDRALISKLIEFSENKLPKEEDLLEFKDLLPEVETIKWLSFILSLAQNININFSNPKIELEIINNSLIIKSNENVYLAKEAIKNLQKPISLAIIFEKV